MPVFSRIASRITGLVAILISVSRCADLLDIPENPVLVPPDPWMCKADEMMVPPAETATPDKAVARVRICNYISTNCGSSVPGITASLCDKLDVKCTNPRQANIAEIDGDLAFEVPTRGSLGSGFDGYLLVNAPAESCTKSAAFLGGAGAIDPCLLAPLCDKSRPDDSKCKANPFIPGAVFFNPPIEQDVTEPIIVPLIPTLAGFSLISAAGAQTTDSALGIVYARGLDCQGIPAAGLTFGVSSGPPPLAVVYQSNGVITKDATETDASGVSGLLGIPAGFATISAYAKETTTTNRREVASIGTQLLASTVSYVTLVPKTSSTAASQ